MNVEQVMRLAPVIPVLVVHDVAHARPIAEALVAGGITALEVTLRTPDALDVIREMAKVDGAVVGAGTVLSERDLANSIDAGARFRTEANAKRARNAENPHRRRRNCRRNAHLVVRRRFDLRRTRRSSHDRAD